MFHNQTTETLRTVNESTGPGRSPSAAVSVRCLHARVRVADPTLEVERAREQSCRGDSAWRERLRRFGEGHTLILALTASAAIDSDGTPSELLCFCHEAVWIDRQTSVAALGEHVCAIARRDFQTVGSQLRDHGVHLSASEDAIAVHLVIDPAIVESLQSTGAAVLQRVGRPSQAGPIHAPIEASGGLGSSGASS
jgi:hypothetical protein